MITYSYLIILKHVSGIRILIMYQILKLREPKDEYPHFQNSQMVISFRKKLSISCVSTPDLYLCFTTTTH